MLDNMEIAQFSELMEHNSKVLAVFSPRGHYIASAFQSQLQIWDANSKEISRRFECDSTIDFIKWSPDSELICCGNLKESVQVWNLNMLHYRCKVSGCLSFANVHWASDSRHLLVISEFYLKITVFSLASSAITEIDYPKAIENGIIFSPCERYLVVAQRINFEDYLGVYSCDTWEVIKTFPVETKDLAFIAFSPNDLVIGIWESAFESKVLFYSIDGRLLGKYMPDNNFGSLSINWSSAENLVAIGDCFGEVKILDCVDFNVLSSYQHPDCIESTDVTLYKVIENSNIKNSPGEMFSFSFELDEVVKIRPFATTTFTPDNEKGKHKNPLKCGVQILQFSFNGKFIASVNGNMPKAVFIYDVNNFKLCDVIIRGTNVKSISWHQEKPYLIICSSSNIFDLWTPKSCIRYISTFESDFPITQASWSPTGECVLLNSRDNFSIVYFS